MANSLPNFVCVGIFADALFQDAGAGQGAAADAAFKILEASGAYFEAAPPLSQLGEAFTNFARCVDTNIAALVKSFVDELVFALVTAVIVSIFFVVFFVLFIFYWVNPVGAIFSVIIFIAIMSGLNTYIRSKVRNIRRTVNMNLRPCVNNFQTALNTFEAEQFTAFQTGFCP